MIAEATIAVNAILGIKEMLANGKELYDVADSMVNFFNAKNTLQKKVNETPPQERSLMQEFFALEKIKQEEAAIKELMIYQGRPGLWEDWLKFQAEESRKRKLAIIQAQLAKKRKRKLIVDGIIIASVVVGTLFVVVSFFLAVSNYK